MGLQDARKMCIFYSGYLQCSYELDFFRNALGPKVDDDPVKKALAATAAVEMMKSSSFAIFLHGLAALLKVGFECINVK